MSDGFDAIMLASFTAEIAGRWKRRADLLPRITAAAVAVAGTAIADPGERLRALTLQQSTGHNARF